MLFFSFCSSQELPAGGIQLKRIEQAEVIAIPKKDQALSMGQTQTKWVRSYPQLSVADSRPKRLVDLALKRASGVLEKANPCCEVESDYQVETNQNNILGIVFGEYSYGFGAAHPNTTSSSIYLDVSSGKVLSLSDFFVGDFKSTIRILLNEKKPECAEGEDSIDISKTYYFADNQLVFLYNPYDICSYADGPQEIAISKGELFFYASNLTKNRIWGW